MSLGYMQQQPGMMQAQLSMQNALQNQGGQPFILSQFGPVGLNQAMSIPMQVYPPRKSVVSSYTHPVRGTTISPFDTLQIQGTQPVIPAPGKNFKRKTKPSSLMQLLAPGSVHTGESPQSRQIMYNQVSGVLDSKGKKDLKTLLSTGVLTDNRSEDGHSMLYHLYGVLSTPRANGLDNATLVREMVTLFADPFLGTQREAPLLPEYGNQLLQVRNPSYQSPVRAKQPNNPLSLKDINIRYTGLCDLSNIMFVMMQESPAELARQLNELSSPMLGFYERARLEEISPDDPSQAFKILEEYDADYYISGPGEVKIKFALPEAGYIRAQNAVHQPGHDRRTATETLYHSALAFLGTARVYDAATDYWGSDRIGLPAPQTAFVESIIKEKTMVPVTYQIVGGVEGGEDIPYLYGYTRTFEQITHDIITALKQGGIVTLGYTNTNIEGGIEAGQGHIISITGAQTDPTTGELMFTIFDSDDGNPNQVKRSARSLVPKIHHLILPLTQAKGIFEQMEALPENQYYVPGKEDFTNFNPIPTTQEPLVIEGQPESLPQISEQQQLLPDLSQVAQDITQQIALNNPQAPIFKDDIELIPYFVKANQGSNPFAPIGQLVGQNNQQVGPFQLPNANPFNPYQLNPYQQAVL